jgi:hypothetical protein
MERGEEIHAVEVVNLTIHAYGSKNYSSKDESKKIRTRKKRTVDSDDESGSEYSSAMELDSELPSSSLPDPSSHSEKASTEGKTRSFFAVGTIYPSTVAGGGMLDAQKGRVLLFSGSGAGSSESLVPPPTAASAAGAVPGPAGSIGQTKAFATNIEQRLPWLSTGLVVNGGVYCVKECKGYLIVGVNSSVCPLVVSPLRLPNTPYRFLYSASKNHAPPHRTAH